MLSSRLCLSLSPTLLILLIVGGRAADEDKPRLDAYGDPLPAEALQRLGPARFRTDSPARVALSPDGKTLAVSGREAVVLYETASGKEIKRLPHGDPSNGGMVVFSPNGSKFVAGTSHTFQLYDAVSGNRLSTLEVTEQTTMRGAPGTISFSRDGKRLALGTDFVDGKPTATFWDVDALKKLQSIQIVQDYHAHVALSGDGKILATWSQHLGFKGGQNLKLSRLIQLWDTTTAKELKDIEIEGYTPWAVALSPDGKQLAVAEGRKATLSLWDVESGKNLHRLAVRRTSGSLLCYSPDSKRLVVGDSDGAVQLWEAATGKRLGMAIGPKCSVEAVAFLPENKVLAAGFNSQALYVWEVPSGRLLTPGEGHISPPTSLSFSPDGQTVLSGASDGIRLWDAATGKAGRHLTLRDPNAEMQHRTNRLSYRLSPDGRHVLCASDEHDSPMRLVEATTEQEVFTLQPSFDHRDLSTAFPSVNAAFSSDGITLAVTGVVRDPAGSRTVQVWNLGNGREGAALKLKNSDRVALAVSADGRLILTAATRDGRGNAAATNELTLWDAVTGKERWTQPRDNPTTLLAFSPDGEFFVAAAVSGLYLSDTATGTERRPLDKSSEFQAMCLAFSRDGRTLAVGGQSRTEQAGDGKVCLWEMATAKRRGELAGHRGGVSALAFSPDGRTLASGGQDTTVLLWDLTGKRSATIQAVAKPRTAEFDALWTELADADAEKAYRLVQRLTVHPAEAVALVKTKLPVATIDTVAIEKWITQLDHNTFERREQAHKALAELGQAASTTLTKAMQSRPSPEKKRHLTELLDALKATRPRPEMVRPTRALELLERVGTPEAKQVLEELAKGDPEAKLTQDAKATLRRLERRP